MQSASSPGGWTLSKGGGDRWQWDRRACGSPRSRCPSPSRCQSGGVPAPDPDLNPSETATDILQSTEAASVSETELRAYIRRNLLLTAIVLFVLLAILGALGTWYDDELRRAATSVFDTLGVGGLALVVFAADSITSPIPPDLALIVIANSTLRNHWWPAVLFLGVVSTCAGCLGWWIGGHLGQTRFAKLVLQRSLRPSHRALISRYGRVGVIIGALTPVPFSITCWLAGMVGMKFSHFLPASALRIPRVLAYYVMIAETSRFFSR